MTQTSHIQNLVVIEETTQRQELLLQVVEEQAWRNQIPTLWKVMTESRTEKLHRKFEEKGLPKDQDGYKLLGVGLRCRCGLRGGCRAQMNVIAGPKGRLPL